MFIRLSPTYVARFKKLTKHRPELTSTIEKKIKIFITNPRYPSLKLHKLQGGEIALWSFWIEGNLRITFIYDEKGIMFVNIGGHDEVY